MSKMIDRTGQKFGKLTVIKRSHTGENGMTKKLGETIDKSDEM